MKKLNMKNQKPPKNYLLKKKVRKTKTIRKKNCLSGVKMAKNVNLLTRVVSLDTQLQKRISMNMLCQRIRRYLLRKNKWKNNKRILKLNSTQDLALMMLKSNKSSLENLRRKIL